MQRLYTPDDVARILGRSRRWVITQARQGLIPHRLVGRERRFTEADLSAYLASVASRDPWQRSAASEARLRASRARRQAS